MSLPSPWTEPVWQAICDLAEESGKGTALRQDVLTRTGAPFVSLVDEAVKRLIEERGCVIRIKPGVFMPVQPFEEEACSFTVLENSFVKLEKGDVVMSFTPRGWARFIATVSGPRTIFIEQKTAPRTAKAKALEKSEAQLQPY